MRGLMITPALEKMIERVVNLVKQKQGGGFILILLLCSDSVHLFSAEGDIRGSSLKAARRRDRNRSY